MSPCSTDRSLRSATFSVPEIDATGRLVTPEIVDVHTRYENLTGGTPHMACEPAGDAQRLAQKARGYRHTSVAGIETVTDDEFSGELPGRLVRGPQRTVSS
jgi:N-acyl-D-aspartate/D-glutamate deacylase